MQVVQMIFKIHKGHFFTRQTRVLFLISRRGNESELVAPAREKDTRCSCFNIHKIAGSDNLFRMSKGNFYDV